MKSPLDHIGRRPKRSPFGSDLRIYRAPKPARRLRAKLILAAFMGVATLATGLFIQVRLAKKPDSLIALEAEPAAAAAPTSAGDTETATLMVPVQPTKVRTVSIPVAVPGATEEIDPDTLSHDDPRWGPAQLAAAAKAKAARTTASAKQEPPLAFAAPDAGEPDPDSDQTAAIAPTVILPEPVIEEDNSELEPNTSATVDSARPVKIARAVNLRSSPRSGSKVIRVLPAGVNVGLYSCKGWCEVSYQGSRGFIYKSFLQGGGAAPAEKPRAAAPKAAAKKPDTLLKILTQR